MKSSYIISNGNLEAAAIEQAVIIHYNNPSEIERTELVAEWNLEPEEVDAIFDPDEVPRIDYSPERTFIIWKRPDNVSLAGVIQFEVSSIGLILKKDKAVVVTPKSELSLMGKEFRRMSSPLDFCLHVMLSTIHHYHGHLKTIKMMANDLESKLMHSMENRYLLQMFAIGESLVYYLNALESNDTILHKMRAMAERLGFNSNEIEKLENVMIENQQAAKQARIYSSVLSGLMDARGTIINNNMNVLLKNLTIINVVFLPLNLIASIGGMSEFTMMTEGIDWRISYSVFMLAMIVLGLLTWLWLVRAIDRWGNMNKRRYKS